MSYESNKAPCVLTMLLTCSCTRLIKTPCSSQQAQALATHLLLAQRQRAATSVQWPACSGQGVGAAMPV